MMQVEFLQSWQDFSSMDSSYEQKELYFADEDAQVGNFEFPSPSMSVGNYSHASSSVLTLSPVYAADDLHNFPNYGDESSVMFPMEQCFQRLEDVDTPSKDQFMADKLEVLSDWMVSNSSPSSRLCSEDGAFSQILSPATIEQSIDVSSVQASLVFPSEGKEVDHQLSLLHLLKAYGDAMELEQEHLANQIARRVKDKANPAGATLERLAYYLMQASDKQVDYLSRESNKNYDAAFRAFYQIFPYGRFAHFTANSVILKAIPEDAGIVHFVDFDIGKGLQWPPLIEELGRRGKYLVKITSIGWVDEHSTFFSHMDSFEETRKRLCEHARICGVRLKMEEKDMEGLVSEIKKPKKRGGRNEWLALNCMAGLPHMERVRSIKHVVEFLKVAKDLVNRPQEFNDRSRGIITVGSVGEVQSGFESSFKGKLAQLQAFFESIESHFPGHFTEARTAIECLFMAPQVSSLAGFQKSSDRTQEGKSCSAIGLKAWRMSARTVMEAKQLVREGESLFWVKSDGENKNQIILGYMGTPLVRVSSWSL